MGTRAIRCAKFFLTLLNIVCIVLSLVVVAVCVMQMRAAGGAGRGGRGGLAFLLALGLALLAAAALGAVAALREHVKTLYTHACFLVLLVSVEVLVVAGGAAVSALAGGSQVPSPLRASFFRNFTADDDIVAHTAYWDKLQIDNSCCGVDGPGDYEALSRAIPASCCARAGPLREGGARRHLHAACLAEAAYYARGCGQVLHDKAKVKRNILISTAVVFAVLEVVCIVLALWLARVIRRERRKLQQNLQAHFET